MSVTYDIKPVSIEEIRRTVTDLRLAIGSGASVIKVQAILDRLDNQLTKYQHTHTIIT